tara:strand:- start:437 stop:799 length:363 start_codon:yes stop_codon:yes gene_type:complete
MASPNTRIEQLEKQMALLMKEKGVEPLVQEKVAKKGGKKAKKDEVKPDPAEPKKKRTSGYIIFSNANREEVKERLAEAADEGEKPKNTEVMKELARMWKELDDDEKAIWNAKAKSDSDED